MAKASTAKSKSVKPSGKASEAAGRSRGSMPAFRPVNFNAKTIPPDAPEGEWEATIKVTKEYDKENYPRLKLDFTLEEAADEDNESFVGKKVTDWITFYDEDHRNNRFSKLRLRDLAAALDLDLDIIPTKLKSWADLKEFIAALDGEKITIWTTVKDDRANVRYTDPNAPRGGKLDSDDEDDEDETDEDEDDEDTDEEEEGGDEDEDEEEGDEEDEDADDEEDEEEDEEETPPPNKAKKAAKKGKAA